MGAAPSRSEGERVAFPPGERCEGHHAGAACLSLHDVTPDGHCHVSSHLSYWTARGFNLDVLTPAEALRRLRSG